jgi:hypothetical protein
MYRYMLITAFAVAGCTAAPDSSRTKDDSDAKDASSRLASLEFVRTGRNNSGKELHFKLTNQSKTPICYSGYSPTYLRSQIQKLSPAGWKDWSSDWCGTGAQDYWVEPGGFVEFFITLPNDPGPIRLGIYCLPKDSDQGETIWTRRLDPWSL